MTFWFSASQVKYILIADMALLYQPSYLLTDVCPLSRAFQDCFDADRRREATPINTTPAKSTDSVEIAPLTHQ